MHKHLNKVFYSIYGTQNHRYTQDKSFRRALEDHPLQHAFVNIYLLQKKGEKPTLPF